jgi:hypothetical protein
MVTGLRERRIWRETLFEKLSLWFSDMGLSAAENDGQAQASI